MLDSFPYQSLGTTFRPFGSEAVSSRSLRKDSLTVSSFSQAVRELNIKAKNWKDLLTDEPFTRADIITIQDPNNVDASKLLTEFDHVKQNRGVTDADAPPEDPTQGIRMSEDHKRVFQSLGTDEVSH